MYSDIKVGDELLVTERWGRKLAKVSKTTKTRFEIGGSTFLKENGSRYGGSSYSFASVKKLTEKEKSDFIESVRLEKLKKQNLEKIKNFNFKSLEIEDMEQIIKIIEKEKYEKA